MSALNTLFEQPLVIRAGWTLVHFLWQGSVIAIVLGAARGALSPWLQARARYTLSCVALALMAAAPPLTFAVLSSIDPSTLPRPIWQVGVRGFWDRILPWIVVTWFCGVVLFSTRVLMGWRAARRLRNTAVDLPPLEWRETLQHLILRMRVSAQVRLLLSPLATAPAVVGWLRPVILMPVEAIVGLPLSQVRSLLAHELAHIRRNDYLVNILQSLAEALLFYHPAVWWVSGQIRAERELCCDDLAVEASDDVLTYATALAALETFRRARIKAAIAADGGSLLNRIRRLAGEAESMPHNLPGPAAAWALAALWLAGAGAVVMHAGQSQPARALRPFTPPGIAAAPQVIAVPPLATVRSAPLLSALLFNPFFAPPQAPPRPGAAEEDKKLASISGSVISTAGKPVANATVRLVPAAPSAGSNPGVVSGPPQSVPPVRTDAEGKFSLGRVPPGSYTLEFEHKDYLLAKYGSRPGVQESGTVVTLDEGRSLTNINMTLPETATFVGRMVDEDGDPVARADVQALVTQYYYGRKRGVVFARTDSKDNGEFRLSVPPGRYYLVATTQPAWSSSDRAPIPSAKPGQKYVRPDTTFWGGARHLRDASQVDIAPGQNFLVGEFKMANIPIVHVRGKVVGDPALLKGARVVRVPAPGFGLGWSYGADILPDGSFDMANMWPYEHTIGVYSMDRGFLGWSDIVVKDEDLERVVLNASAAPLSGTVAVEGAPADSEKPAMSMRIELLSTGYYKVTSAAVVKTDGTFTILSMPPGPYFINVSGLPRNYYVKTARLNARDVLNQLDWGGLDVGPMEIVVSPKAPVFEGSVVDGDGNPVNGAVTLVPDPLRPGNARIYPTAKADQRGRFRFNSVSPGSYKVFAWETILDTAHWNAEFIEPFTSLAERIELKEGENKTIVLKRISAESMQTTLRRAGR